MIPRCLHSVVLIMYYGTFPAVSWSNETPFIGNVNRLQPRVFVIAMQDRVGKDLEGTRSGILVVVRSEHKRCKLLERGALAAGCQVLHRHVPDNQWDPQHSADGVAHPKCSCKRALRDLLRFRTAMLLQTRPARFVALQKSNLALPRRKV